jgi:hypothetical protein
LKPQFCIPAEIVGKFCFANAEMKKNDASSFESGYGEENERIRNLGNNRVCHHFKHYVMMASHYAMRSSSG